MSILEQHSLPIFVIHQPPVRASNVVGVCEWEYVRGYMADTSATKRQGQIKADQGQRA